MFTNKHYIIIAFLLLVQSLAAQEQDSVGSDDSTKFRRINSLIDKFKEPEKFQYFKQINQSKTKAEFESTDYKDVKHLENRTIRSIEIIILDPLGNTHVESEEKKISKFSNKLQRSTPQKVVCKELLINEGDALNISDLIRTERSLYNHPNFRASKIDIIEYDDPTYVDIKIILQDIWSWNFFGGVYGNGFGGNLIFNKFLGRPQQLIGGINFNIDRNNPVSPNLSYQVRNILGSHVDAGVIMRHDWYQYQYNFRVQRQFFNSPKSWAGSFEFGWNRDKIGEERSYHNAQDLWLAKALPAPKLQDKGIRLLIASRAFRRQYTSKPFDREREEKLKFDNNQYYIGSIGIASERFYKRDEIFQFDFQNILPRGISLTFLGGIHIHETFATRGLMGGNLNYGLQNERVGYFYASGQQNIYLNQNRLSEVGMGFDLNYISPEIKLGKWKMINYLYQSLSHSWNLPEEKVINLSPDDVKALRLKEFDGSGKYNMKFETAFLTPKKVAGFRANFFAFADIGLQGARSNQILNNLNTYQAYGFGMRLNNWSLGIAYLEISLAYYTDITNSYNSNVGFVQRYYNDKIIPELNLFNSNILTPR